MLESCVTRGLWRWSLMKDKTGEGPGVKVNGCVGTHEAEGAPAVHLAHPRSMTDPNGRQPALTDAPVEEPNPPGQSSSSRGRCSPHPGQEDPPAETADLPADRAFPLLMPYTPALAPDPLGTALPCLSGMYSPSTVCFPLNKEHQTDY